MAQRRFNFIKNSNAYILHKSRMFIFSGFASYLEYQGANFVSLKADVVFSIQYSVFHLYSKVGVPVKPVGHRFFKK